MASVYARRTTDFTGDVFLDDVECATGVDATYASVVQTVVAPTAVYSKGGLIGSSKTQYRVDEWAPAVETMTAISGLVLAACIPHPGMILAVYRAPATTDLWALCSSNNGDTWWYPSASAIPGTSGANCPSAARILANYDTYGSAILVYIDPATGTPKHRITRNMGVSWA